jgi:hypothetical protein
MVAPHVATFDRGETLLTQLFPENYHAWKDDTGFVYDIMLTKVDTLTNSNERINLTIFESNAKPLTYATNLHFAGTGKCPMNNILAALGCNLNTAMRFFRQAFHEKTGCSWDDRIKVYNERVRARQNDLERFGATRGGSMKSHTRAIEDAIPFGERVFEYVPPLRSSVGLLPDGSDEVPEVVRKMREQDRSAPTQIDPTDDTVQETAGDLAAETLDFDALFGANQPSGRLGVPVAAETDGETAERLDFDVDVKQLLAGASDYAAQDSEAFDVTTLQSEEHPFNFDLPYETQPNQTQLATAAGEGLLNFDDDQNVASAHESKRKRDDEVEGGEVPAAKKAATEHSE